MAAVPAAGLCASCGLCAAVCPVGAVSYVEDRGSWVPSVGEGCVGCGRCLRVCPGRLPEPPAGAELTDALEGPSLGCYSAWAKDASVLANAVSGGVVTALVGGLLGSGAYDAAYVVRDVPASGQPRAVRVVASDDLAPTQKSRYLQVSHEATLRGMLGRPGERAVVVAVPCAARGLLAAVRELGIDRGRLLLVGLFCDRTMTGNVLPYLERRMGGRRLSRVNFRDKDVGGWPGDVRLFADDGSVVDLGRSARMEAKDYFQPERCLCCLDKLNALADISVGDDYVRGLSANGGLGACSVVVRTARGMAAWEACADALEAEPQYLGDVARSQRLGQRAENLAFLRGKRAQLAGGHPELVEGDAPGTHMGRAETREYRRRMARIAVGRAYGTDPARLERVLAARRSLPARAARKVRAIVRRAAGAALRAIR